MTFELTKEFLEHIQSAIEAHDDATLRADMDELFPAEQARIVQLLVERVDIGIDGLDIRMRLDGMASLASEMRQAA